MYTETLLVNSEKSKNNCDRYAGSLRFYDSSITLTTATMSTDFSKICRRPSGTIWFVHDIDMVLDVDQDNRWDNKWQFTIKGVG